MHRACGYDANEAARITKSERAWTLQRNDRQGRSGAPRSRRVRKTRLRTASV